MRRPLWGLALCLVSVPVMFGQQRPPTLGPSQPSLRGPSSARTADARLLLKMHTVYIERIDHDLNDRLTDDLAHASWLKVVDKKDEADAVVRGTCFDLPRLKRLHAEIYINDRYTGKSIWQDVIAVPYGPPALPAAVDQAAAEILAHLNESMHIATRR